VCVWGGGGREGEVVRGREILGGGKGGRHSWQPHPPLGLGLRGGGDYKFPKNGPEGGGAMGFFQQGGGCL